MRGDRLSRSRRTTLFLCMVVGAVALAGLVALLGRGTGAHRRPRPASPTSSAVATGPPRLVQVAPDGSDSGPGTPARPWRTLAHALPSLRPGDTLLIGAGTYSELLTDLHLRRGRLHAPIRVHAAAGAHPLLRGLLWMEKADYWDVSGLDVTWNDKSHDDEHMVKFTDGKHWSFRNAELSNARSFAALLVTGHATHFRLSDLYVHDTVRTNNRNQDQLVYINTDARGGVLERCLLVNSHNGRGVKVGPPQPTKSRVGDLTIRYNTFYNNLGPSNVQLSYGARGVQVYRNILVRPGPGSASVTTFHLRGGGNVVYDNLVYQSTGPLTRGQPGLKDLGGNILADPGFLDVDHGDFRTTNFLARAYGRYGVVAGTG